MIAVRCLPVAMLVLVALALAGCPREPAAQVDPATLPEAPVPETTAPEVSDAGWGCVFSDGDGLLWVSATAASKPTSLLEFAGERWWRQGEVAPDQVRVAVIDGDSAIRVIELASGEVQTVAEPLGADEEYRPLLGWSPDGQHLAWLQSGDLYVTALDADPVRLTTSGQVRDFTWSPDGTRLAFCLRDEAELGRGLWTVGVAGGDERQIVEGTGEIWAASHPSWSPDGRTIAFTHAWEGGVLCFVGADGSDLRADIAPAFGKLQWLADSSGVFYDAAANEVETEGVWFCPRDGEPQPVIETTWVSFDALPSGDIAFVWGGGEGHGAWLTTVNDAMGVRETGEGRLLPFGAGQCAWRPDGQMIAVWSLDEEEGAALLVAGREGEVARIAEGLDRFVGWARREPNGG